MTEREHLAPVPESRRTDGCAWFAAGSLMFVFAFVMAIGMVNREGNAGPVFLVAVSLVAGAWLERGRVR